MSGLSDKAIEAAIAAGGYPSIFDWNDGRHPVQHRMLEAAYPIIRTDVIEEMKVSMKGIRIRMQDESFEDGADFIEREFGSKDES